LALLAFVDHRVSDVLPPPQLLISPDSSTSLKEFLLRPFFLLVFLVARNVSSIFFFSQIFLATRFLLFALAVSITTNLCNDRYFGWKVCPNNPFSRITWTLFPHKKLLPDERNLCQFKVLTQDSPSFYRRNNSSQASFPPRLTFSLSQTPFFCLRETSQRWHALFLFSEGSATTGEQVNPLFFSPSEKFYPLEYSSLTSREVLQARSRSTVVPSPASLSFNSSFQFLHLPRFLNLPHVPLP